MGTTVERLSLGVHSFQGPGITLSYVIQGTGPLLVVQAAGWEISSRYLQIGFEPLEEHFTLIFLEPRGSGLSGRPANEEDMSDADMADDPSGSVFTYNYHESIYSVTQTAERSPCFMQSAIPIVSES
jgi:hypothetical protein